MPVKPTYTLDQIIYQLQTSWNGPSEGNTRSYDDQVVTYSFPTTAPSNDPDNPVHPEASGLVQMSGVLIPKDSASKPFVAKLNAGWLGITQDHIKDIAGRARTHGSPGVIVVAFGAMKAALVGKLIEQGYVNHLVIDRELAAVLASKQ